MRACCQAGGQSLVVLQQALLGSHSGLAFDIEVETVRTSNASPGDAAGVLLAKLRALGSIVGVGNHVVGLSLEALEGWVSARVLQRVQGCAQQPQHSQRPACLLRSFPQTFTPTPALLFYIL